MTTLLVPYSIGSRLKSMVQKAEDAFSALVGGGRVRVIEQGGDVLSHLVGRNDPWAASRTCGDPGCLPCRSRTWLKQAKKDAKKAGGELPPCLLMKSSHQCHREGVNYSLQCLICAMGGGLCCLMGGVLKVSAPKDAGARPRLLPGPHERPIGPPQCRGPWWYQTRLPGPNKCHRTKTTLPCSQRVCPDSHDGTWTQQHQ